MHNRTLNSLQFYEITIRQHENAAPTYTIQWASDLGTGVTISTSTWSTEDSNLTIASEANTTTQTSARLSSTSKGTYTAVNKITTSDGDTFERILRLIIGDNNKTYDYGR